MGYIDFFVDRTESGQVDVPLFADYNSVQRVNPKGGDVFFNWGFNTTPLPDNASMQNEDKTWHRMYCPLESQFFQYEVTLSDAQRVSREIHNSSFVLNALIIWVAKGSRLVK
jgi:hypothetical protein